MLVHLWDSVWASLSFLLSKTFYHHPYQSQTMLLCKQDHGQSLFSRKMVPIKSCNTYRGRGKMKLQQDNVNKMKDQCGPQSGQLSSRSRIETRHFALTEVSLLWQEVKVAGECGLKHHLRTDSSNQDPGLLLPLWFLLLEIHRKSPTLPANSNYFIFYLIKINQ